MQKKALWKDSFRTIKDSLLRFIALVGIIALGSGFFVGIRAVEPTMVDSADEYYDAYNLADIDINSTYLLRDKDIDLIKQVDGIDYETYRFQDRQDVENEVLFRVFAFNEDDKINQFYLAEGRFPEKKNEIAIDANVRDNRPDSYDIGSKVTFDDIGVTDNEDLPHLSQDEFTITGYVYSPMYMNTAQRGRTNVGKGSLDGFALVSPEVMQGKFYSGIKVDILGAEKYKAYSDEYQDVVDKKVAEIEDVYKGRETEVFEEIKADANDEIASYEDDISEGKEEIQDAKDSLKDAREELDEARKTIAENKEKLEDSEKELEDQKQNIASFLPAGYTIDDLSSIANNIIQATNKLNNAKQKLQEAENKYLTEKASAEEKIKAGETKLKKAKAEIAKNEEKIKTGEAELAKAKDKLSKAKKEYKEKEQEYKDGIAELKQARTKLDTAQKTVDSKVQAAINNIEDPELKAQVRKLIPEDMSTKELDLAKLSEISTLLKDEDLTEQIDLITSSQREINENQEKIDAAEEKLNNGQKELDKRVHAEIDKIEDPFIKALVKGYFPEDKSFKDLDLEKLKKISKLAQIDLSDSLELVITSQEKINAGEAKVKEGEEKLETAQKTLDSKVEAALAEIEDPEVLALIREFIPEGTSVKDLDLERIDQLAALVDNPELAKNLDILITAQKDINKNRQKLVDAEAEIAAGQKELDQGLHAEIDKIEDPEVLRIVRLIIPEDKSVKDFNLEFLKQVLELSQNLNIGESLDTAITYQEKINEGTAKLEAGKQKLNRAQETLDSEVQKAIGKIEDPEVLAIIREYIPEDASVKDLDLERIDELKDLLTNPELAKTLDKLIAGQKEINENAEKLSEAEEKFESERENIEKALKEAKDKLQEGDKLLKEKETELKDGKAKLQAGKEEFKAGKDKIANAKAKLSNVAAQIASGKEQISASEAELSAVKNKISQALPAGTSLAQLPNIIQNAEDKISQGKEEIAQAEDDLSSAEDEYDEESEKADKEISDAEDELADAEDELETAKSDLALLEEPTYKVNDRNNYPGHAEYKTNSERIGAVAKIVPIIFFLIAALVSYTVMTRMVQEEQQNIGTYKSMGYSASDISTKFMVYAVLATVLGVVAGIGWGNYYLPKIIIEAYGMLYDIPLTKTYYYWSYISFAAIASLVTTLAPAILTTRKSLTEVPAELMRPSMPKGTGQIFLEKWTWLWDKINFQWKVSLRNIFRYFGKNFMVLLGVAGCTMLLITGFGINDSISGLANRQFEGIQMQDVQMAYKDTISDEDIERISSEYFEDDLIANYENYQSAIFTTTDENINEQSVFVNVFDDETSQISNFFTFYDIETGEQLEQLPEDGTVYITHKLAKTLKLGKGDTITLKGDDDQTYEFKIAAVVENYIAHYLFMTKDTYEQVTSEDYNVDSVMLRFTTDNLSKQENYVSKITSNEDDVLSAVFITELQEMFNDALETLKIITYVLIIAAAALDFIVLFSLINVNVSERYKELATIRVLGATPFDLTLYVYREVFVMIIAGIILGSFLGPMLLFNILETVEVDLLIFPHKLATTNFVMSIGLAFVFSLIVMVIMHFIIRKIDMVEALKSE